MYTAKIFNPHGAINSSSQLTISKNSTCVPEQNDQFNDARRPQWSDEKVSPVTTKHKIKDHKPDVKVPIPRKFKFEPSKSLYQSDYESDIDGGEPLKVKWRAYSSDSENVQQPKYRKVKPNLTAQRSTKRKRRISPPCPHKWESHEDIDQMLKDLRDFQCKTSSSFSVLNKFVKHEPCNLDIQRKNLLANSTYISKYDTGKFDHLINSSNNMKEQRQICVTNDHVVGDLTEPQNVKAVKEKPEYVRVKEKIKFLEKKVEQQSSELSDSLSSRSGTPSIRPEDIPGAVRVLPSLSSPKQGKFDKRSLSSTGSNYYYSYCNNWITRSRHSTASGQEASGYDQFSSKRASSVPAEKTSSNNFEEVLAEYRGANNSSVMSQSFHSENSTSMAISMTANNTSSWISSATEHSTTDDTGKPKIEASESECEDNLVNYGQRRRLQSYDGYEADTDDTLTRKRKSVKDMATRFQNAENKCPSARPLRPKTCYYSQAGGASKERNVGNNIEPPEPLLYKSSQVYVDPPWILSQQENIKTSKESQENTLKTHSQTKLLRFNSQWVQDWSSEDQKVGKFEHSIPVFRPMKFVPGKIDSECNSSTMGSKMKNTKIKAVWVPSDSDVDEPSYRKVNYDQPKLEQLFNNVKSSLARDTKQLSRNQAGPVDPQTGLVFFKYDFDCAIGVMSPDAPGAEDTAESLISCMTEDQYPKVGSEVGRNVVISY